ncbi:putative bifunctional diguanylate cyclase/phosphodiesterase [Candidatus Kurthia intestinigallinarum]|uniref:putative bifunctional diguanylate cyclase/phosphodiesterase n=1 Tax=Candidatus Kurthia intestinigallinarum TaxID=1562256 RepID=UPI001F3918AD|nr:EAL domain-containing protein [Kurthia sp. 3B1D]
MIKKMEYTQKLANATTFTFPNHIIDTIFNSVEEGIMIADTKSRIIHVNPAFEFVTGYTYEEAVGQRSSLLNSGIHDQEFYTKMWATIREHGKWSGEIWNRRKTGDIYPEWLTIVAIHNEQGDIVNYCGIFEDISAQKNAENEIERRKYTDTLTGVANRYAYLQRMETLLQSSANREYHHAVLFLDLDRFKQVNDTLGHSVADEMLISVTQRIQSVLKNKDIVARYGGDEFIITITNIHHMQEAVQVAEKIVHLLSEPLPIDEQNIYISTSMGISLYPEDGTTLETLVKKADQAMYYAKQNGRNQFAFYFDDLKIDSKRVLLLDNELRKAIKQNDFTLNFQPKISLEDKTVIGMEALIRWTNDQLGFVSPAEFIPYAEETGLIIPMSECVFRLACEAHLRLREEMDNVLPIAINISSIHFHQSDFIDTVKMIFEAYNCSPQDFELELTERTVMNNERDSIRKLVQLKNMGFKLSIDDFGTGYSSLSYLVQFPLDYLKIDRSFIQYITSIADKQAVVDAIIQMAHRLHMKVIAEGVEQKDQVKLLEKLGCDMIQGYYYAKPMPLDEFVAFLEFLKLEAREDLK